MGERLLRVLALAALVAAPLSGACAGLVLGPSETSPTENTAAAVADGGADDPGGINTTGVGAGTGANTGLPCDVQQLLENRCIGCHLATSESPLLSFDDLLKPSKSDPTKTMAAVALARMQNTAKPMPPPPAVGPAADEIAILKNWIGKKTPRGTLCTPPPPPAAVDAGAAATTNYNTPLVCTSQKMWTNDGRKGFPGGQGGFFGGGAGGAGGNGGNGGNGNGNGNGNERDYGSPLMEPGKACMACHLIRGGPAYRVAGTVYPTAHEPDDCNGVNGGVEVIILDANGVQKILSVNSAGNFSEDAALAAPFRVKVKRGAQERVMAGVVTAGDCNGCHSVTGVNGAPGRVMAP